MVHFMSHWKMCGRDPIKTWSDEEKDAVKWYSVKQPH